MLTRNNRTISQRFVYCTNQGATESMKTTSIMLTVCALIGALLSTSALVQAQCTIRGENIDSGSFASFNDEQNEHESRLVVTSDDDGGYFSTQFASQCLFVSGLTHLEFGWTAPVGSDLIMRVYGGSPAGCSTGQTIPSRIAYATRFFTSTGTRVDVRYPLSAFNSERDFENWGFHSVEFWIDARAGTYSFDDIRLTGISCDQSNVTTTSPGSSSFTMPTHTRVTLAPETTTISPSNTTIEVTSTPGSNEAPQTDVTAAPDAVRSTRAVEATRMPIPTRMVEIAGSPPNVESQDKDSSATEIVNLTATLLATLFCIGVIAF